jgi:hypothetical protein
MESPGLKLAAMAVALTGAIAVSPVTLAQEGSAIKHVLLISIDGMHAVDYQNCVAAETCPTLKDLGHHGVHYTRTSTSRPSDSFPGLVSIVTGGTPKLFGGYYDVAYDRVLAPPKVTTGNGVAAGTCTPGQPNGTRTEYEEGVEFDQTQLGGGFYTGLDAGYKEINPDRLPRDPFNNCQPVYPWNFIRANTIFGVIHGAGGYTAWADKHAVYALVSGPTGTATPSNVDDYYSPEINSNVRALPGVVTASDHGPGFDCGTLTPQTGSTGDYTGDFDAVKCNDQLKVNAVVNWIGGRTHLGATRAPVPTIFGMNFQAVSVGEKLIENGVKGGYSDAAATPTPAMQGEIEFVDAAIGQMVKALKSNGLYDSTTIIITAKHGQSPIDTNRFFPIPGHSGTNGNSPATLIANDPTLTNNMPLSESPNNPAGIGSTEDDISLLWLTDPDSARASGVTTASEATVLAAVNLLEANASQAGIGQIFYEGTLETIYGKPGIPDQPGPCCAFSGNGGDPRVPDIIVAPNVGVVYTGSAKKQAEHGGFAQDDTNVMLLVSHPGLQAKTVDAFVETSHVAPTILRILGLDPTQLKAVQVEGTPVLPGLGF